MASNSKSQQGKISTLIKAVQVSKQAAKASSPKPTGHHVITALGKHVTLHESGSKGSKKL